MGRRRRVARRRRKRARRKKVVRRRMRRVKKRRKRRGWLRQPAKRSQCFCSGGWSVFTAHMSAMFLEDCEKKILLNRLESVNLVLEALEHLP